MHMRGFLCSSRKEELCELSLKVAFFFLPLSLEFLLVPLDYSRSAVATGSAWGVEFGFCKE